jgi:hypothetical protein
VVTVAAASAGLGVPAAQATLHPDGMHIRAGVAMGHVPARHARLSWRTAAATRRSPNMLFHGGAIMPTSNVTAIYWGTKWGTAAFTGDKVTGEADFYGGYGGSAYADTSDEYTGTNGQVSSASSYQGSVTDTSAAPTRAPSTSAVLAEVAKKFPNPDPNGYYAVYVDTKRGSAGYCAWHSYGTINGKPVIFAFFFNLDGDAGCDPQDSSTTYSQGTESLSNVAAHELSEARTDPSNGGWWDSSGAENGDKCAWTFNTPSVTLKNNTAWKLQGEWSNAAYLAGTGYPDSSGHNGCLDGHAGKP